MIELCYAAIKGEQMNSRPLFAAASLAVCLASLPLAAQSFPAGDEGWTTQSSSTQIDLGAMPIVSQALGAPIAGNGIANLTGVPLNSSQLGNTDTIVGRGAVSGGKGTASVVALNLASASPVQLTDGRSYALQICLPSGATQPAGSATFQPTGSNAGNMTASVPVSPRLVFTNTSNPQDVVRIDCSAGGCPSIQLSTQNAPYVVATASQASASGIGTLPSGNVSVANCGSQLQISLAGQANLYEGATFASSGKITAVNIQLTGQIVVHLVGPFVVKP
jgi:hypothetical protein